MTVVIMASDPFSKQKTYLSDIWPWTSFTWTEDRSMIINFVDLDRGQIYDHELRWPGQWTDLWLWPSFTLTEERSMTKNLVYLERWQIYDYDLRLPGQRTDLWPLFIQFCSQDSQYHKMKYFPMMINIIYQFCFQDSENYLRVYNLIWPLFHKLEVNANWVNRWMNLENQTKFLFFFK